MMDEYYRYEYEDNGVYCYPHTHILRNKLDIHDKDQLFKVEQELSSVRYFELIKRQYKHVADIMTYDDLVKRLENIVISLRKRIG